MKRMLVLAWVALFFLSGAALADDPAKAREPAADAAAQLKQNPDNAVAVRTYVLLQARQILTLANTDADKAEKQLTALADLLNALEPTTEEAQEIVEQAKGYVNIIEQRLKLVRTTLEQLAAELKENPADEDALNLYQAKVMSEVAPLTMYQPAEAAAKIDAVTQFLKERQEAVEDEEVKTRYERAQTSLVRSLQGSLERGQELAKTLDAPAAPLEVEAWANGEPLTSEDLKDKVVLLDFWAVWCGPCIATFPHLREWQEKYADKGLVIIGLTRYYQYTWNEDAQRASRSQEEVTPEQEQEMLAKFAAHHDLKHRFAIQKDDSLTDHYKVSGIPHVVLIDRQGKVRLYRIGSGEKNAQDVQAMIETLLAEGGANE